MFNFHRPKTYRSSQGCCICRAKSSSSRFTDSLRYEEDFVHCFKVLKRQGEICNACVLLVKRWKKLPKGHKRDWQHVVDARAGPGNKSMIKIRAEVEIPKKHKHRYVKKPKIERMVTRHSIMGPAKPARSRCASPLIDSGSDDSMDGFMSDASGRRAKSAPTRNKHKYSSFLDMTIWKKSRVCCGIIFKGPSGEILIDPRFMHPCAKCPPKSSNPAVQAILALNPQSPEMTSIPQDIDTCSRDSGADVDSSHSDDVIADVIDDTSNDIGINEDSVQSAPDYVTQDYEAMDMNPDAPSLFSGIAISMLA